MMDKLKAFGDSVKNLFLYLVAPLLVGIGYVLYLTVKMKDLKLQVEQDKEEKDLAEAVATAKEADNEANKSEADYNAIRNQYLSQHPNDS